MGHIDVLYVDPAATAGDSPLRELAGTPDISVSRADSLADAKAVLDDRVLDCVVTEYDLPDGTGLELIAALRERAPDTGAILVTAASPARITEESGPHHVAEFVPKTGAEVGTRVVQLVEQTAAGRSQTAYPLPPDERARLDALATIDFDDELLCGAIERVTTLATDHFGVAQSSVNVVAERTQVFLADETLEPTSREDSACTYTILDDGVTVIEDIASDPRFSDNELVAESGVRFYAGATLATREGHPVGTLCVYDEEPRVFGEADRAYLALLAADVMDWLEVVREPAARTVGDGGRP